MARIRMFQGDILTIKDPKTMQHLRLTDGVVSGDIACSRETGEIWVENGNLKSQIGI